VISAEIRHKPGVLATAQLLKGLH